MKSKYPIYVLVSAIVLILLFLYFANQPKSFLEAKFFDSNGNQINSNGFSVVDGADGVRYIQLIVNIENTDTIPLSFRFDSLTPSSIIQAIPTNLLTIEEGDTNSFQTSLIDVVPFDDTTTDFCVTISSIEIPSVRTSSSKSDCITFDIQSSPEGSFDINLEGVGSQSPPTNPSCTESWTCGPWSTCSNSAQTRICTDANACGTTTNRPPISQVCASQVLFETNAIPGAYTNYIAGTYIRVDADGNGVLEEYDYSSTISSGSCIGNLVVNTPEGYEVHKYSGSSGINMYICNPSGSGYKRYF